MLKIGLVLNFVHENNSFVDNTTYLCRIHKDFDKFTHLENI